MASLTGPVSLFACSSLYTCGCLACDLACYTSSIVGLALCHRSILQTVHYPPTSADLIVSRVAGVVADNCAAVLTASLITSWPHLVGIFVSHNDSPPNNYGGRGGGGVPVKLLRME